ncbi:SidC [Legionella dresdenensis]|uniref:SidC n=1 Tax=Legionella dresdenensis TaxID=450200 RepID=A0ABV8CD58_9GAMM
MKLPLKEPLTARYLYLSPENTIHIFMPIVSGSTIGLDNTCKAVYALQVFFGKGSYSNKKESLKTELLAYKEALESDMSLPGATSCLTTKKQERLAQIDGYLTVLAAVENHSELNCLNSGFPSYPESLVGMMKNHATSNLYSMVLRPEEQDGYLRTEGVNPLFRVAHKSVSRNIESAQSPLQKALIKAFTPLTFQDLKAQIINKVLEQLEADNQPFKFEILISLLEKTVQKKLGVALDFSKTSEGVPITQDYINNVLCFDNNIKLEYYIGALYDFCAEDVFTTTIVSPFKYLTEAERWSIATQFLLGLTNIYAVTKDKTREESNWGEVLDKQPELSTELAQIMAQAQQDNANIEEVCLLWLNKKAHEFKLKTPFTTEDIKTIKQDFAKRYMQIKDAPHFDEFFVLDPEKKGPFVMHQGSIGVSFASFVSLLGLAPELLQPLEKARQEAPHLNVDISNENTLVQNDVEINTASLDKAELQALYERINSHQDPKLKEQLAAQLKIERPDFEPQINSRQFLQLVAYGQQNEAENLLKKDRELAQELLIAYDIPFTDYSGRTFTCSAYEYTWWAKDSHMRFMLERYMNDDTKKTLLKRVQYIEELIDSDTFFKRPRGLVYTQQAKEYRSAHFDLTPLKNALRTYIEAYEQSPKRTKEDWEALDAVWIQVNLPQREVPAHIAQEYCHPARSFDDVAKNPALLDASNPANLERTLKFYNCNTGFFHEWFTPQQVPEGSGLGSSFAIMRATRASGAGGDESSCSQFAAIDLSAIEAIDEVRTKDLKRSFKHLAEVTIEGKAAVLE